MKLSDVSYNKLSPMMQQYVDIKKDYQDALLFFRLGDFYELFFEDGLIASRELELTLTGKSAGIEEKIPMCGVPFHAVLPYLEKLVNKGYKVAICEQLENPKNVKGVVKRGVVQVLSKGTVVDPELLKSYENNYIASILDLEYVFVLTYADISTGVLYSLMLPHLKERLFDEILLLNIKEIVLNNDIDAEIIRVLKNNYNVFITRQDELLKDEYNHLYCEIQDEKLVQGVQHLLYYLVKNELKELSHIEGVTLIDTNEYLKMDIHTLRNLELIETVREKTRVNSLIWLLDKTKTAMGSRRLKYFLLNPLKDIALLNQRYDYIELFRTEFIKRDTLRCLLDEVYDLERLVGKATVGNINARDLLQLKNSFKVLPSIKQILKELKFKERIETHSELFELFERALYENPPLSIKEGFLINSGYNKALDELKEIRSGSKSFLASLEARERERTGIKNLKLGYTRVYGYYFEVTRGQLNQVKEDFGYERRQTLTGAERFISPELKEKEALILNAEEKINELEWTLFNELKEALKKETFRIKQTAKTLSEIDAFLTLSIVADENNFIRPILTEEKIINIKNSRHPVIEKVLTSEYIANDIMMDSETNTLLITGPNMAGKSTYMRQLAITVIMAQMGSFVPASFCSIPVFDQIWTRIGASDDLVSGESTFMVEMLEARNAIIHATDSSLILFDELGRGTATFDGMSLAQAILEYVNTSIKCKILFSTHYHELTTLAQKYSNIKNVHVEVLEKDGDITFIHKIKNGAVDKSYGIHVAKLAKLPDTIINRANEILDCYENKPLKKEKTKQLSIDFKEVKTSQVEEKLKSIDPLKITPIEAINILYELKEISSK